MDKLPYTENDKNQILYTLEKCEQFFGGTELENGFEKSKHFTTYWLKTFSSDTHQSIKRQNKGPKEHDEKIYTQLWIPLLGR